jgi:hypothetical protein
MVPSLGRLGLVIWFLESVIIGWVLVLGWLMVVGPSDGGGETVGCVSGVGGEESRDSVGRQAGEGIWAEVQVDWEWAGSSVKGIWACAGVVADRAGGVALLDEAV